MENEIIDNVNDSLVHLLYHESGNAVMKHDFDISFAVPDRDFKTISIQKPTANFYLYHIELRSDDVGSVRRNGDGLSSNGRFTRIILNYLITTWSAKERDVRGTHTRDEHKLLSRLMMALIKYPKIPKLFLHGELPHQTVDDPETSILSKRLKKPGEFWAIFKGGAIRPALEFSVSLLLDCANKVTPEKESLDRSCFGDANRDEINKEPFITPPQTSAVVSDYLSHEMDNLNEFCNPDHIGISNIIDFFDRKDYR